MVEANCHDSPVLVKTTRLDFGSCGGRTVPSRCGRLPERAVSTMVRLSLPFVAAHRFLRPLYPPSGRDPAKSCFQALEDSEIMCHKRKNATLNIEDMDKKSTLCVASASTARVKVFLLSFSHLLLDLPYCRRDLLRLSLRPLAQLLLLGLRS